MVHPDVILKHILYTDANHVDVKVEVGNQFING